MARADESIEPSGVLVGIDLSDTDGEGTVCTEAEAQWYENAGRVVPRGDANPLSVEDVWGNGSSIRN